MAIRHDPDILVSRRPFQLGYVTNDLDWAIRHYGREMAAPRFSVADRELHVQSPNGPLVIGARIALAFVDDLMIELIEPVSGDAELYRDTLPGHGYATLLHHLGYLVNGTIHDWDAFRARINDADVVWERRGDPSHVYLDTAATLGHYVEYIWLSPERLAGLRERVPRN